MPNESNDPTGDRSDAPRRNDLPEPGETTVRSVVEERLGRPVLDELEAAVVLEAYAGLPADQALRLGRQALRGSSAVGRPPVDPTLRRSVVDGWSVLSDVAFVVGVLAVGYWLSGQIDRLGLAEVDRGWRLALPVSLAAQWFLRRRSLTGPDGIGRLRHERSLLVPFVAALVLLSLVPVGGPLAASLATTWIAGFVISRRGWGVAHALGSVGVLALFSSRPIAGLVLLSVASAAGAALAIVTTNKSDRLPGPASRSIASGGIGFCLALFLVAEPAVHWQASSLRASLTIVPALLGSMVGGVWMTRIWSVLPASLLNAPLNAPLTAPLENQTTQSRPSSLNRFSARPSSQGSSSQGSVSQVSGYGHGVGWVFLGGLAAALFTTALASVAVLSFGGHASDALNSTTRLLLVAHGALAVCGLCVSLLEAFGSWAVGLAAAATGAVLAFSLESILGHEPEPGLRILVGAAAAFVLSLVPLIRSVRRPAHRIAVTI